LSEAIRNLGVIALTFGFPYGMYRLLNIALGREDDKILFGRNNDPISINELKNELRERRLDKDCSSLRYIHYRKRGKHSQTWTHTYGKVGRKSDNHHFRYSGNYYPLFFELRYDNHSLPIFLEDCEMREWRGGVSGIKYCERFPSADSSRTTPVRPEDKCPNRHNFVQVGGRLCRPFERAFLGYSRRVSQFKQILNLDGRVHLYTQPELVTHLDDLRL